MFNSSTNVGNKKNPPINQRIQLVQKIGWCLLFATAAFSSSFRTAFWATSTLMRPTAAATISHCVFLAFFDLRFVFAEPFLEFVHCCGFIKKIKRNSTQQMFQV